MASDVTIKPGIPLEESPQDAEPDASIPEDEQPAEDEDESDGSD